MNEEPEEEIVPITVYATTDKVGSKCSTEIEFEKEEWEEMTDTMKEEACKEAMWDLIEWGFTPTKDYCGDTGW